MKFGADNVAMNSMGLLAPETSEVNRSSCQELMIREVLSSPLIPCFRCGVCCTRYQVRLSLVEARRIADQLSIAWPEFQDRYLDQCWPGVVSFLLRQRGGTCVFLKCEEGNHKASCLVHRFRPSSCRDWTSSLCCRDCQAGLTKHWGLSLSPSGQLQGPEEKLRDFHSFLESLE